MKYGRYVILISIFASVLQAKIIFNDHPLNPLEVRDILQELRHEYGWSKRQTVLFFAVGMHESQTFKFRCAPTARSYNDLVPINTQKNGKESKVACICFARREKFDYDRLPIKTKRYIDNLYKDQTGCSGAYFQITTPLAKEIEIAEPRMCGNAREMFRYWPSYNRFALKGIFRCLSIGFFQVKHITGVLNVYRWNGGSDKHYTKKIERLVRRYSRWF